MPAFSFIQRVAQIAGDASFPARCYGCGRLYHRSPRGTRAFAARRNNRSLAGLVSDVLCRDCARIDWIASPMCTLCGRPFATTQGIDHLCADCRQRPFSFDGARAVGVYGNALQLLVPAFKYQGLVQLAAPLGRLMWDALAQFRDVADIDCIIPVPLHWHRKRRRGFNQAELLIRQWPKLARDSGVDLQADKIVSGALIRYRSTPSQTGLGQKERKRNLRRAFRVKAVQAVLGSRVLIVDDVFTTGATADACARALKRAGAASVHVLTLARAV